MFSSMQLSFTFPEWKPRMTSPHVLHSSLRPAEMAPIRTERASASRGAGNVPYTLHLTDCLAGMDAQPERSIQAIVTDPPYGLREYTTEEKRKLRNRKGGVWRIPPSFDGCQRNPVPRFTKTA